MKKKPKTNNSTRKVKKRVQQALQKSKKVEKKSTATTKTKSKSSIKSSPINDHTIIESAPQDIQSDAKESASTHVHSEASQEQKVIQTQKTHKPTSKKASQKKVTQSPLTSKTPFVLSLNRKEGKKVQGQSKYVGWRIVDAKGQRLGRLSSYIAHVLMGKDKPVYTRFTDTGDHVVVINAQSIVLTGNKHEAKEYFHHTNYPGGIKRITAKELFQKFPERIIEKAVYRMLPRGAMGRLWFSKLHVYRDDKHPHQAQKPKPLPIHEFIS